MRTLECLQDSLLSHFKSVCITEIFSNGLTFFSLINFLKANVRGKYRKKFQGFLYLVMDRFSNKKVQCLHVSLSFFSSIKQKHIFGSLGSSSVCCYASKSTHHHKSGFLSAGNTIQTHPEDLLSYAMDLNDPMFLQ